MDVLEQYKQTRDRLLDETGIHPDSKFIKTDGPVERIHYLEAGSGDPIIFVHGGLSHSSEWIPILKPLADYFHLYVVDRPGHGLSDPIDYRGINYRGSAVGFIKSFMDAIQLDRAHVIANSMGGYFSICFSLEHPERVNQLFLMGAPAGMNLWIPPMLRILGISGVNRFLLKHVLKPSVSGAKNIHKNLIVFDTRRLSNTYYEHGYYNQLLPASLIAHTTLLESALTLNGWRKRLYLTPELNKLHVPTHFIWGDKDVFEHPRSGIKKAALIKNHTFEVIENGGHCPWLDRPDQCVSQVLKILIN